MTTTTQDAASVPSSSSLSSSSSASPFLSERQRSSLQAIVRAFLPPLSCPSDTADDDEYDNVNEYNDDYMLFWNYDVSNDDNFMNALVQVIQFKLSPKERRQLLLLLTALGSGPMTNVLFMFTYSLPLTAITPFARWAYPEGEQTRALQSWQHCSKLPLFQRTFSNLKRLVCALAFSYVPPSANRNPFWDAMDYPGPPPPTTTTTIRDFDTTKAFLSLLDTDPPSPSFETTTTSILTLEYDVVIVGSGAGGGVAAAIFAEKGYQVLVVEKGSYVPPTDITNFEVKALDTMYERHALLTTNDGNIVILAGSTLGGGTTINWACCLSLPPNVRRQWSQMCGLTQFAPTNDNDDYSESLRTIQERIGCCTMTALNNDDDKKHKSKEEICHNEMNRKLIHGCDVMGYNCQTTGQNLRNTAAKEVGYTCFGDAQRNKQSGIVTFLKDAIETNNTKIITDTTVERILWNIDKETGRKRATGVVATTTVVSHPQRQDQQQKIHVSARKCVIVSAGSLHSPCVLQRSGFRNPHIGRHLHLHPVTAAFGFYNDNNVDTEPIHPYLGAPMTTVCSDFTNVKLECPSVHPGLAAASFPFLNVRDFKSKMLRLKNAVSLIVLTRDVQSEGRVRVGSDGFSPSIDYTLRDGDRQNMMDALQGAIKILVASGATEVGTGHIRDTGFLPDSTDEFKTAQDVEDNDRLRDYLTSIHERGLKEHEVGFFSAHQMSTCRMSTTPESGVVDENGEVWECDDLFVFDASVFPTASGANPMLTTLTISHMLSSRLARRLQLEDNKTTDMDLDMAKWMAERRKKRARQPRYYRFDTFALLPWTAAAVAIVSIGLVKYLRRE